MRPLVICSSEAFKKKSERWRNARFYPRFGQKLAKTTPLRPESPHFGHAAQRTIQVSRLGCLRPNVGTPPHQLLRPIKPGESANPRPRQIGRAARRPMVAIGGEWGGLLRGVVAQASRSPFGGGASSIFRSSSSIERTQRGPETLAARLPGKRAGDGDEASGGYRPHRAKG